MARVRAALVWIPLLLSVGCTESDERSRSSGLVRDASTTVDGAPACSVSVPMLAELEAVDVLSVRPIDTDDAIDQLLNHHHLVHEPEEHITQPEVVLLLAGAGSGTNHSRRLAGHLARAGFRTISLAFVNEFGVGSLL